VAVPFLFLFLDLDEDRRLLKVIESGLALHE
jgi:hypothetical protein